MAAINTYAGKGGTAQVQFYTDQCPVCGNTHVLYAKSQQTGWYWCYAAGQPGTLVQTAAAAAGTPIPSAVQTLIDTNKVIQGS